jgi:hypothetical protein
MVAYNFRDKFALDIEQKIKCQTFRPPRKRHAKPGEPLQLYTGMRTKNCRKLLTPDPICKSVKDWRITPEAGLLPGYPYSAYLYPLESCIPLKAEEVNAIAKADGFTSAVEFFSFFFETYGFKFPIDLVEICWA